jgi:hypothetical protein
MYLFDLSNLSESEPLGREKKLLVLLLPHRAVALSVHLMHCFCIETPSSSSPPPLRVFFLLALLLHLDAHIHQRPRIDSTDWYS